MQVLSRSWTPTNEMDLQLQESNEPSALSILGLQLNVKSDSLEICRGMEKEVPVKVTQLVVLSQVSSVFDPL